MNIDKICEDERFKSICAEYGLDYKNSFACKNAIFVFRPTDNIYFLLDDSYEIIGTDIYVKSDVHFRESLIDYRLDFYLFDKAIALETPQSGLYFLLDRNFNCFDIVHSRASTERELEHIANISYLAYTTPLEDLLPNAFAPFQNFSSEMLLNLACRLENVRISHGWAPEEEKISITINRINYTISATNPRGMMFCFFKYLSETAKLYFKSVYPLMATNVIGFAPSLCDYISRVATELFASLFASREESLIASVQKTMFKFGQIDCYEELRPLAEMTCQLMRSCNFDMHELAKLANSCLGILAFPDEEFRRTRPSVYDKKDEEDFEQLFQNVEEKTVRLFLPA